MRKRIFEIAIPIAIFCLAASFISISIGGEKRTLPSQRNIIENKNYAFPIDATFTSNNGCVVHIVGDLTLTFGFPPKIKKFTGTVTISGGHGCPNGTLTFGNVSIDSKQITVDYSLNDDDPCTISTVTWSNADQSYLDLLNDSGCNSVLIDAIRGACS